MNSRVLVSLRVAASPARAFQAFTEEIGAWWRPNPLFAFTPAERQGDPGVLSFEPGPAGRLILTHRDGEVFEVGRIVDSSPPARWRSAGVRRASRPTSSPGWRRASKRRTRGDPCHHRASGLGQRARRPRRAARLSRRGVPAPPRRVVAGIARAAGRNKIDRAPKPSSARGEEGVPAPCFSWACPARFGGGAGSGRLDYWMGRFAPGGRGRRRRSLDNPCRSACRSCACGWPDRR